MKLTGYLISRHGIWGPAVGWATEGWDGHTWQRDLNAVYVSNSPTGATAFATYVDGKYQYLMCPAVEDGRAYKVEIAYADGKAQAIIAGRRSPTLPAPTIELPEWNTDNIDFHRSWTEIPELWLPMPPWDGPPLPSGLEIKWPWQKI